MQCIKDFEGIIHNVFQKAEDIISTYPQPLAKHGLDYLSMFHPFREESKKNYICYFLPFWLRDIFPLSEQICTQLATGNIFAMLHFFIQDDIIDDKSNIKSELLLPLGNLFYGNFLEIYQSLSPSFPVFWSSFQKHLAQWAEAMIVEENPAILLNQYAQKDLSSLSQKSSPIKITIDAMAYIAKKEDFTEITYKLVDKILIVLQLIDDWTDWKEDLKNKKCSYILYQAMKYNHILKFNDLKAEHVYQAIFIGDILSETFISTQNSYYLTSYPKSPIKAPYLTEFLNQLYKHCESIVEETQKNQISMIENALDTLLS